jgi:ribosome maturation factor RimP
VPLQFLTYINARLRKFLKEQLEKIEELIKPTVEMLGLELWGFELHKSGKHSLLRVYIDRPEKAETGVTIDDCAKVSEGIGTILDLENPISGGYNLEVSSPGASRTLFKIEHYKRFIGQPVKIKLHVKKNGQQNFSGIIVAVDNDIVTLKIDDNRVFEISFADIEKANLIEV